MTMDEITRAVHQALENPPDDLEAAARQILPDLWSDLDEAKRSAINGRWSMACDWITRDIVILSRLAGVTPWQEIPTRLLTDGVYQSIMREAALPFEEPDMALVRDTLTPARQGCATGQ
jgi:hypothetical protein